MTLRISLCQMNIQVGEPEKNIQKAADWISRAAGAGSRLVLLPELWSTGYDLEHARQLASPLGQGIYQQLSALAKEYQVWLGGSTLETAGDKVNNTFTLYNPEGALAACYRKIHLFRLMDEHLWLEPGKELVVSSTDFGLAGISICYDLRFPEMYRYFAVQGARLFLISAEWPVQRVEHWRTLLRARAIENQVIIAAVNATGESAGTTYGGSSAVVGAWGETLGEAAQEETLLTVDIDLAGPDQARQQMDILKDRRPEIYG